MSTKTKPPPPDKYSAFKQLLGKIAKVPKAEADEKEAEYQRERARILRGIKRTG